jgi:hypothetical protein
MKSENRSESIDAKWISIKPSNDDKINEQVIKLLSDNSITCTVLFAVKENKDGSKFPVFLVSKNFRDPQFFVDDFVKLLGEHAKFNQIKDDLDEDSAGEQCDM